MVDDNFADPLFHRLIHILSTDCGFLQIFLMKRIRTPNFYDSVIGISIAGFK